MAPPLLSRWTAAIVCKIVCSCIALLLFSGCGENKEPKEHLRYASEKITGIKTEDITKIREAFLELKTAYERGDFHDLKRFCAELDERYDQRILSWYADILFIEHTKGLVAAQEAIGRLKAQDKLSRKEARALDDIEDYFKEKGNMSTARLFLNFYLLYLEAEYGHGASAPLASLLEITDKFQTGVAPNRSQPIRTETNSTSSAAGSRR